MNKLGSRVIILFILVAYVLLVYQALPTIGTQGLVSVSFTIYYDLFNNTGIMVVNLQLSKPIDLEPPYEIMIPVKIFGVEASLSLINYSVSGIRSIALDYDDATGSINIIYDSPGTLEIFFVVENAITPLGEESFEVYIDSTEIGWFTRDFRASIIVSGLYEVVNTSLQGAFNVSITHDRTINITRVDLSGIGEAVITMLLKTPLEEYITGRVEREELGILHILMILIAIIVVIAIIVLYFRKRRKGIELETIDVAQDDAIRAIVRVLKETGNKGLTQAEIVKHTGLPKSSVSRRVRRLVEEGYVEIKRVGKFNYVYLTSKGLEYAKRVVDKD